MSTLLWIAFGIAMWAWGCYERGRYERRHRPKILKSQIEADNRAAYQRGRIDREREIRAAVSSATASGHEHLTPPYTGISERDQRALPRDTLGPAQLADIHQQQLEDADTTKETG